VRAGKIGAGKGPSSLHAVEMRALLPQCRGASCQRSTPAREQYAQQDAAARQVKGGRGPARQARVATVRAVAVTAPEKQVRGARCPAVVPRVTGVR